MQRLRSARRSATVLTAAGLLVTTLGIQPASAANVCATDRVEDDGVAIRACFGVDTTQTGTEVWTPKVRMAPIDNRAPSGWSACTVDIRLYSKPSNDSNWTRRRRGTGSCLTALREDRLETYVLGKPFAPQAKYCYATVATWVGTYNGVVVPHSTRWAEMFKCKGATSLAGTDLPESVDVGDGVVAPPGDLSESVDEPVIPAGPVEDPVSEA